MLGLLSSTGMGVTRLTIPVNSTVDPAGDQWLLLFDTENYYWQHEITREALRYPLLAQPPQPPMERNTDYTDLFPWTTSDQSSTHTPLF